MRGKSRAKSTSASTESHIGAIAPSAFRDVAALASFRDLIAISTITLSRALELRHRRGLRVMFGEAFAIYPWMLDRGGYALNTSYALLVGKEHSFKLKGEINLELSVVLHYKIIGDQRGREEFKIKTVAYYYVISDPKGKELLAYHWHPEATPDITYPHVHIGGDPKLKKYHLPTEGWRSNKYSGFLLETLKLSPG